MNAIKVLEAQQGDLEDLFHEIAGAKDVGTRRQILDDLAHKLALMAAYEGHVLRRAHAATPESRDSLRGRFRRSEDLVADLRQAGGGDDDDASAKLDELHEEVDRRAEEVETEVIPQLATFSEDRLWLLGVELIAIRRAFETRAAYDVGAVRSAA